MVFTDGGIEVDISAYGYAQGSEMEDSEEEGGHLHEHGENDDTNDAQNDDGALELERTRREEALAEAHDEQAVLKDEAEGDAGDAPKLDDGDAEDGAAVHYDDAWHHDDDVDDDDGFVKVKLSSGFCFLRNSDPQNEYSSDKLQIWSGFAKAAGKRRSQTVEMVLGDDLSHLCLSNPAVLTAVVTHMDKAHMVSVVLETGQISSSPPGFGKFTFSGLTDRSNKETAQRLSSAYAVLVKSQLIQEPTKLCALLRGSGLIVLQQGRTTSTPPVRSARQRAAAAEAEATVEAAQTAAATAAAAAEKRKKAAERAAAAESEGTHARRPPSTF